MGFLLEVAVSAFFLAAMSAVGFLFFWRVRGIERQMSILLKAALTNTREIRHCARNVDDGFSAVRQADNHRRVLLASLNSQMSELNRMMSAKLRRGASDPTAHWPASQAGQDRGNGQNEAVAQPLRVVAGAELPGYRVVRRSVPERVVATDGAETVRRRKIQRIEELFRKVELPLARTGRDTEAGPPPVRAANDVVVAPREGAETSFSRFAELISQRRRVVNG